MLSRELTKEQAQRLIPAQITLRVANGDTALLDDVLSAGFTAPPVMDAPRWPDPAYHGGFVVDREGPAFSLSAGPGIIALAANDLARAERRQDHWVGAKPVMCAGEHCPIQRDHEHTLNEPGTPRTYRRIWEWSRKSRCRMVRRIASTDWRPLIEVGVPVMITLTYPRNFGLYAPTAAISKAHVKAWGKRYERRWGTAAPAIWKMEFQAANPTRHLAKGGGAPHYHLLLPLPKGVTQQAFREWLSTSWEDVVWADRGAAIRLHLAKLGYDRFAADFWISDQRAKHLSAGTGFDLSEGLRARDPRRIAVYFLKHSMKTKDGKEYQNRVPSTWTRPGRFWGVWVCEVSLAKTYMTSDEWHQVRRLLRRWAKANGRSVFQSSRSVGGWVAVNDGAAFLASLSRAMALADMSKPTTKRQERLATLLAARGC